MEGLGVSLLSCLIWLPKLVFAQNEPSFTALDGRVGSCTPITTADIGNITSLSTTGLVAKFLSDSNVNPTMVRIIEYNVVCESLGLIRETVASTSFIVQYECLGSGCLGNDPTIVQTFLHQFQMHCNRGPPPSFSVPSIFSVFPENIITVDPTGDLFTPASDGCGSCFVSFISTEYDSDTHCASMYIIYYSSC